MSYVAALHLYRIKLGTKFIQLQLGQGRGLYRGGGGVTKCCLTVVSHPYTQDQRVRIPPGGSIHPVRPWGARGCYPQNHMAHKGETLPQNMHQQNMVLHQNKKTHSIRKSVIEVFVHLLYPIDGVITTSLKIMHHSQ